jgi:hypothetical protein
MPWWAHLYLAFLLVLTVASVVVDRRRGVTAWRMSLDVASMAVWAWFVVAHFHPPLAEPAGRWTALAFLGTLIWTGIGVHREIAELRPHPELTPRANLTLELAGIATAAIALVPAVTMALLVMRTSW